MIVPCPCCKGYKYIWMHSDEFPDDPPQRLKCCHCDGEGTVEAEICDTPYQNAATLKPSS